MQGKLLTDKFKTANEVMRETISAQFNKVIVELIVELIGSC